MTDNVVRFRPANEMEGADAVLERAQGIFDEVLVIGFNKQGEVEGRVTLGMTERDAVWMMEILKFAMMNGDYDAG